jgi:predicted phage tail protein
MEREILPAELVDTEDKVIVVHVLNPFDALNSKEVSIEDGYKPLHEYLIRDLPEGYDFLVVVNGDEEDNLERIIKPGESIAFLSKPAGGDDNKLLRTVLMIVLIVVANVYGGAVGSALGLTGDIAAAAGSAIIMTAGSYLIGQLLPPPNPALGGLGGVASSPTYGWGTQANPVQPGGVLPVVYGETRAVPTLISKYVTISGDDQILNLLYAVCEGPVNAIKNVQINNTDASRYTGVEISTRLGTNDQTLIPAFDNTRVDNGVNAELSIDYITRTTTSNIVDSLEVVVTAQNGLGQYLDNGSIAKVTVPVTVQYSVSGLNDWQDLTPVTSEYKDGTEHIYFDWVAHGQYVKIYNHPTIPDGSAARIQAYTLTGYSIGTLNQTVLGVAYPASNWTSATYDASSSIPSWLYQEGPEDSTHIEDANLFYMPASEVPGGVVQQLSGNSRDLVKQRFVAYDLAPEAYDIRVRRDTVASTNTKVVDTVAFSFFTEVIYDDFTYPNTALLAVKALATEQLNGAMPLVTCTVDRGEIGGSLSSNPAVACKDILTNTRYGLGIDLSNIDLVKFAEWEAFCDANGYEVHIYLDQQQTVRDTLHMVALLGRGMVIQSGSSYSVAIAKAETPTQAFMFTMGNMLKDSFTQSFIPIRERANLIEITYFDRDLNYERTTLQVTSSGFDEATQEVHKTALTLFGCVDKQQAIKYARFLLNQNQKLTMSVSWEADIESIACTIGDIVRISHDVPNWGYSGRLNYIWTTPTTEETVFEIGVYEDGVYIGTTDTMLIRLDRSIFYEVGKTYIMYIKDSNTDIVYSQQFTVAADIETDVIPVQFSEFRLSDGDVYTIGELGQESRYFRINTITRASDMKRQISALEYIPEVYDDNVDVIELPTVSTIAEVENLQAYASYIIGPDGLGTSVVNLAWSGTALEWEVWYRKIDETRFTFGGTTKISTFRITGLEAGEYLFSVNGEVAPVTVSYETSIVGNTPIITNVTLLKDSIVLEWSPPPELYGIKYYSVKLNGVEIISNYSGTTYTYTGPFPPGDFIFEVASIDAYGSYSAYVTADTINIPAVPDILNIDVYSKQFGVQFYIDFVAHAYFSHVEIWESTINDFSNAVLLTTTNNHNYRRDGLPAIATRYYWFRLVDTYGNFGTYYPNTSTGIAASTSIDPDAILAELYNQQGSASYLPVLTDILITGYIDGIQTVGLDGNLVVDGTIVAGKIAANSITTNELGVIGVSYFTNDSGYTDDTTANAALSLAQTKNKTYYQDTEPASGMTSGDLWVDTNDGNHLYTYDGAVWQDSQDTAITTAYNLADGKTSIFYTDSTPTANNIGDTWVTITNNVEKVWNGTAWVLKDVALAINTNTTTIDGAKITTGSITTDQLSMNTAWAGVIYDSNAVEGNEEATYTMKIDFNNGEIHIK